MDKTLSQTFKILVLEQTALHANFLLCTSFCFQKFNQQKRVGMVSTNDMLRIYSDQIYNPF